MTPEAAIYKAAHAASPVRTVLYGRAEACSDARVEALAAQRFEVVERVDVGASPDWGRQGTLAAEAAVWCGPLEAQAARAFLAHANAKGLAALVARGDPSAGVRPLEMADMLARPADGAASAGARASIEGRRVLVTGAGGSIGSELVRQIAALDPGHLILLDNSEFNLYSIDQTLQGAGDAARTLALCDIRDGEAVQRWFSRTRPEIVFHAAALKQVPLVEAHAGEGVLTNVLGTRQIAAACLKARAHMVLVSTDKAVSPSNAMGATKRLAELYCQALDRRPMAGDGARFLTARLGNVLGSAGSVAPLFERQIASGGPVTVTHPDVTRFFITIPQAAAFLLESLAIGLADAQTRGAAHVLDMGAPISLVDFARDMIRLKGLRPEVDVAIAFIGLRPGEKVNEQLVGEDEWIARRPGARIMAVRAPGRDLARLEQEMDALVRLARAGRDDMVKAALMGQAEPVAIAHSAPVAAPLAG